MKKVLLSLATVICGFFLFPMPSFAARLDTHSGIVKTNAPNQMAYSTEYLGGALGHYICAGDWYNIVRIYNNSTRYATYPITVPNGIRTITETHYFYGPLFINYADSSTGTFSYYFNPDQWYNYLPSPISYTDQSDSGATDNGSEIYVSNNQGFFVQADSFNNSKLICYDGYTVMRADYVAQPCYYNSSDYYNCNWHWARAQKDWSTSGLIQGINTVYFAGTDASANYTTGQVQFLYDTVAPYAGSVSITNITSSGYDVYVYGVGDATSGVSTVKFPTWTKPDQNDIRWDSGTNLGGGTWFFHVNQSNWGNSVYNYSTHVYVYDNAGNNAYVGGQNEISLVSTNLQINYLPPNSSYRVNTDVVTSFTASNIGNDNILPSGNVSVSFSVYYLNGSSPVYLVNECKSGVVIPANNSNLIYFKWHVPDIAGKVIYVSATINSFKTIPETNMDDNTSSFQTVIEAPSNSQTPDTQYESRAPAGYAKTVASAVNGSVTWTEWTYTNGSFSRINYGVQLNVNSSVSPDSSVLSKKYLNGYWHIRSGYGFSVNVSPNISTVSGCSTPPADAYTSAQRAKAMLPEYRYNANALGKYCDLQFIDDTFQFVINSNAQNKRIHFIPLWIPEVEIYSYVTENTFDAYLYQLVESKQKFIGQIMTSKSAVRSAEDIDETALSYAEIKALATGNPHIKEKMDLDIEVQRLKLLKANHLSQRYALEDQIIKTLPQQIRSYEERIAGLKTDMKHLAEQTHPNEDGFSPITIQGTVYDEKKDAGTAILAAYKVMTNPDPVLLGQYRGFYMELSFESFSHEFKIALKNELRYTTALGSDIFGNIQRLDNLLDGFPEMLKTCEEQLDNTRTQLQNAKIEVEKPFPHEDELKTKTMRLDELNILLNMDKRENEIVDGESENDEKATDEKNFSLER